jgi:hypothetical protein
MAKRCAALRLDREPCGAYAVRDSAFCFAHDGELARDRAEARRKGGLNRRTPHAPPDAAPVRLRSPDDVLGLLESTTADTLVQANSDRRSRTIVSLCLAAIRVLEVGSLEERLRALEDAERDRTGPPRLAALEARVQQVGVQVQREPGRPVEKLDNIQEYPSGTSADAALERIAAGEDVTEVVGPERAARIIMRDLEAES